MRTRSTHSAPPAKVLPFPLRRRIARVVRVLFVLATACVVAAIVVQDHTSYLVLGVFNTGADTLHAAANMLLVLALAALALQLAELVSGRFARACGLIRGVFAFVLILNLLLVFGDRLFVTGDPAGLLGQYYEVPGTGRHPVILKKDFSGATRDPCLVRVAPQDGPRVLFLGDSYTEGSGRSRECNYPDVVESVLRERWNASARVVNAGVSGYGPVEAGHLLRWHLARGCPVDAVVFNLVLENDFADNAPRTERRVVAGIISRFPRSWFLRTFHPLNMRAFRWAMILSFFARASTRDMLAAVTVEEGPCDLSPTPLGSVSPFLRAAVERGLANAERVAAHMDGRRDAADAVARMRATAAAHGVPFVLVVFPDRAIVDAELQRALALTDDALAPARANRAFANRSLAADAVLDMTEPLAGPGMFRAADTHLSDWGNVVAGRYVGEALAAALPAAVSR